MGSLLPTANEVSEGNVITPVCHSVHRWGLHIGGSTYRGLHPGVCIWGDSTFTGGVSRLPGYYGIRSTSGRYASYWNVFLLPAATKLWPRLCFYTCL